MTNVYILTKEGREYSREGCKYITETLRKPPFNNNDEFMFSMGAAYNNPTFLADCIDQDPNCYIVISTKSSIMTLNPASADDLKHALRDYPNESSWQLAIAVFFDENDDV